MWHVVSHILEDRLKMALQVLFIYIFNFKTLLKCTVKGFNERGSKVGKATDMAVVFTGPFKGWVV